MNFSKSPKNPNDIEKAGREDYTHDEDYTGWAMLGGLIKG